MSGFVHRKEVECNSSLLTICSPAPTPLEGEISVPCSHDHPNSEYKKMFFGRDG